MNIEKGDWNITFKDAELETFIEKIQELQKNHEKTQEKLKEHLQLFKRIINMKKMDEMKKYAKQLQEKHTNNNN